MRGFALGLSLSLAFILGCMSANTLQPAVRAQAQLAPPTTRWAYECNYSSRLGRLQDWMNEKGAEGWEAVGMGGDNPPITCMKRPLQ